MVLSSVAPSRKIPLSRSHAGHLLLDLTQDWLDGGQDLGSKEGQTADTAAYKEHLMGSGDHECLGEVCVVEHAVPGNHDDLETVLMASDEHDLVQPVDQGMRDTILRNLASSHGAQEPGGPKGVKIRPGRFLALRDVL